MNGNKGPNAATARPTANRFSTALPDKSFNASAVKLKPRPNNAIPAPAANSAIENGINAIVITPIATAPSAINGIISPTSETAIAKSINNSGAFASLSILNPSPTNATPAPNANIAIDNGINATPRIASAPAVSNINGVNGAINAIAPANNNNPAAASGNSRNVSVTKLIPSPNNATPAPANAIPIPKGINATPNAANPNPAIASVGASIAIAPTKMPKLSAAAGNSDE